MATLFNIGHVLTFVQNEDDFREWGFPLLKEKVRLLFPDGNDSSRCRDRIKELEDRVNETNVDLDRELDAQIASTDVGSIIPQLTKSWKLLKS